MPGPDISLPAGRMQGSYVFHGTAPGKRLEIRRDGDRLSIREVNPNHDWPWDSTVIDLDLSEARRLHHGLGIMLAGPGGPQSPGPETIRSIEAERDRLDDQVQLLRARLGITRRSK